MADSEQYVYLQGTIDVNGKTYLPGEPFSMDLKTARHNAKNGVRLLPAGSVDEVQIAAARANVQILTQIPADVELDALGTFAEEAKVKTEDPAATTKTDKK